MPVHVPYTPNGASNLRRRVKQILWVLAAAMVVVAVVICTGEKESRSKSLGLQGTAGSERNQPAREDLIHPDPTTPDRSADHLEEKSPPEAPPFSSYSRRKVPA